MEESDDADYTPPNKSRPQFSIEDNEAEEESAEEVEEEDEDDEDDVVYEKTQRVQQPQTSKQAMQRSPPQKTKVNLIISQSIVLEKYLINYFS